MRKITVAGLAVASLFVATSAMADEGGGGLEAGLRLGYALPMGEAAKDSKMSDAFSGMIPVWVDVGYRIDPSLYAGLYAQYGLLSIKDCPDGADCSGSDIRFGVMGAYHLMPAESFDPWLGFGIGYEMTKVKFSAGGQDSSTTYKGLEFANLQLGGDYKVSDGFAIGPFLSFSLGQYSSAEVEMAGVSASGDITDKGMHQWLALGVRGAFGM